MAPKKRKQKKKDHENLISKKSKELKKKHDESINKAISNKDSDEFRMAKSLKNQLDKSLEKDKKQYFEENLSKKRKKWKIINDNDKKDDEIPTRIIFKGIDTSSPKQIGKLFADFFVDKVEKIRENFSDDINPALETLNELIKKPDVSFNFKEVTVAQVYETIQKLKNSHARGNDEMTSLIMKEAPHFNSMALCHLVNSILQKRPKDYFSEIARKTGDRYGIILSNFKPECS